MSNDNTAISNVIPFNFGVHRVRTLLMGEHPWFIASDVCVALAVNNVSLAVNGRADRQNDGLDDDEKGLATVNTPSGTQDMLIVNESGLYALIFKSRKAEAKVFKKWVTAEVLPAIRKFGRYDEPAGMMATLIGRTIGTDGFHMLGAIIKGKVSLLPAMHRRRAIAKIWSQTHAAFGVRSAEDIPATQLDAARNFIAAYVIEGEFLAKEKGAQINDGPLDRYLVSVNQKGGQHETQVTPVPNDARIMTHLEMIRAINTADGTIFTTSELFDIAMVSLGQIRARNGVPGLRFYGTEL